MAERDDSKLFDVTWWPRSRRPAAPSRHPKVIPSRGADPLRRRSLPRAIEEALLGELNFTIEGDTPPGKAQGYNPYDNRPRANDTLPWKPRVR